MKETGFVMLVEDDEDDVDVTLLAFKRAGLSEVVVARDGVEALEKLAPGRVLPKVIFLDLKMPGIDGIEVLRRVRADERTALLPVVVLRARPSPAIWRRPMLGQQLRAQGHRSRSLRRPGRAARAILAGGERGRGVTAGLRALIIEDNPDDVELVKMELESGGYQLNIRQVATLEALRQSLNEAWDIIYSDYQLDGFNGEDVLAVVRRERGLGTPFIVVSGSVGEEVAVQAMRAGADDYFRKEHMERLAPATARPARRRQPAAAGGRRTRQAGAGTSAADDAERGAHRHRHRRGPDQRLHVSIRSTNACLVPCTASPSAVTRRG